MLEENLVMDQHPIGVRGNNTASRLTLRRTLDIRAGLTWLLYRLTYLPSLSHVCIFFCLFQLEKVAMATILQFSLAVILMRSTGSLALRLKWKRL